MTGRPTLPAFIELSSPEDRPVRALERRIEGASPLSEWTVVIAIVLEDCGDVPQFEHPERTYGLGRELRAG